MPREGYRVGVPQNVRYARLLSTDDENWGGSGHGAFDTVDADAVPFHGHSHSIDITLPPLAAIVLAPAPQ